jgi:hypothetical protein
MPDGKNWQPCQKKNKKKKIGRAKKELAALNGTAKLERAEMRAADEARATGQT